MPSKPWGCGRGGPQSFAHSDTSPVRGFPIGARCPVLLPIVASPDSLIAIFGPTGVGKTAVAIGSLSDCASAGRTPWPSRRMPFRCTAGSRSSPVPPRPRNRSGSSTGCSPFVADHGHVLRRPVRGARARGDRLRARRGDAARSWSAAPASTYRPRSPTWSCDRHPSGSARAHSGGARGARARGPPCGARRARAPARRRRGPGRPHRIVRALELLEMGEEPAPIGETSRLWTANLRRPTILCGLTMERERSTRASRRAWTP